MTTEKFTTTTAGIPAPSDEHSRTVGPDYLLEKLAQFNRERVPERVIHAKGGGAFGTFVVTEEVSMHSFAKAFAGYQFARPQHAMGYLNIVAGEHASSSIKQAVAR
jgi:catalase